MKEKKSPLWNDLPAEYIKTLYKRHFQGAIVRSVASVFMWLFALAAYQTNVIKQNHFTGITLSVLFLVLINPPTLLLLKHITNIRLYKYGSLLINFLEIIGYTAIIYFLGGIEATFLTPIYAALITYVGVLAPRSYTYTVAFMCSAAFSFAVIGEYFGLLPNQSVYPFFNPSFISRLVNILSAIGLLVVVAYISSLTSGILKKNRDRLQEKNIELMEKTALLEEVEKTLRESENRYRELSIVDDLTQLYNSRHFYQQLKMEIDRLDRHEYPLTLLLIDLDDFKVFNDTYGHIEGDQVLLRFGQVIKRCLRKADSAYRYGGEEFTIILPMTTSEEGIVIAERIKEELKKENFSPVPDKHVHLTVSIGFAQYNKQEDVKVFVSRADHLMYQAKKNGKDRICPES